MIDVENLTVQIEDKVLLKNVSLTFEKGKTYALMGPNGSGKSTLAKSLVGHPHCKVTNGKISYNKEDITHMSASQRALKGLFLGFQYPSEIGGITNHQFLFACVNAQRKYLSLPLLKEKEFEKILLEKMDIMKMGREFALRFVNEGFSGGEKKRNEILQMLLLNPSFAILDEIDSGLDIDAMKVVASGINTFRVPDKTIVLITHYERLLQYVPVDVVYIMHAGKIIHTAKGSLIKKLEKQGYDWLIEKGKDGKGD